MKAISALIALLFLFLAAAQQPETQSAKGVIYGTVIGQDGKPAKGVGLTARPLGVALGALLPRTRTDQSGKYRFENIGWWGRYTVDAEDLDAGYSIFATDPPDFEGAAEVMLSLDHLEAELNFRLPPRAGFLQIHLTDQRTGAVISGVYIRVMAMNDPSRMIFSQSSDSRSPILIPPDKDLLLHITSSGFREWVESAGRGKPVRLTSGSRLQMDVQLEP